MTSIRPEDDKSRLERLPETFTPAAVEIDRMLAALRSLEGNFKYSFLRSLTDIAIAMERQLKDTVAAAEEAVRKQTHTELRAKYAKELELALTEKTVIERQLQTTGKEFEGQKQALTAKLEETRRAAEQSLNAVQSDVRHLTA